ncbi:hypothetical protein [Halosimplex pelagicum]|uniref:Uncharacterized protein n=1 Tax=Halosimplex pelagicum TaxID=869886 RepID=A0A7D5TCK7_9EURY|nr:hypothetical protein [Halosimplex pelagicum]QLH82135.1 hypothetical protein HZS54_11200 [Halosimplex pelagicum]
MKEVVADIPDEVSGTPVQTIKSGARLPCPHSDCTFQYWNIGDRRGKRTPTVQDKFSARDEPCRHYHTKWSPASTESLETVLADAAESASEIFCVVDEQIPLDDSTLVVAVYVEQQTTLGGF